VSVNGHRRSMVVEVEDRDIPQAWAFGEGYRPSWLGIREYRYRQGDWGKVCYWSRSQVRLGIVKTRGWRLLVFSAVRTTAVA
jgi:hypothetical protein